jgi:hypothetical protein
MNNICKSHLTSIEVQYHILKGCSLGCIGFGFCYGFIMLSSKPGYKKYLLGMWEHGSVAKILIKICIYIFVGLAPGAVFLAIGNFLIKQHIVGYLFLCLGTLLAGFGLSYLAPVVALKYRILTLTSEEEKDYRDH